MKLEEFKHFFDDLYKAPELRHVSEPAEREIEIFGKKYAVKMVEKRNLEWKKEYEKAVAIRNSALAAFEDLDHFPKDISSFFYSSTVRMAEDDIQRRERKRAAREKFVKDMGGNQNALNAVSCAERLLDKGKITSRWDAEKGAPIPVLLATASEIEWLMSNYKMTDDERDRWAALAIGYAADYEGAKGAKCAVENLVYCADFCKREADAMKKVLGGIPDGFERLEGWGVGGKFNGIVWRGDKRASFKSFLAGGYNIQRLHMRTKVTLLKPTSIT